MIGAAGSMMTRTKSRNSDFGIRPAASAWSELVAVEIAAVRRGWRDFRIAQ
jgi:hypothetical protein